MTGKLNSTNACFDDLFDSILAGILPSAYWRRVPFDRRSAQQKSPALKRPKIFKLSWMAPLASECSFAFVLPCPSAMQMGARDAGLAQGKSHSTLRRAAVSLKLAGEGGAMLQSQASLAYPQLSRFGAKHVCNACAAADQHHRTTEQPPGIPRRFTPTVLCDVKPSRVFERLCCCVAGCHLWVARGAAARRADAAAGGAGHWRRAALAAAGRLGEHAHQQLAGQTMFITC